MEGDKNKNALLLSLLVSISTFQQKYHDNNQLAVTKNEMVGLHNCHD